MMEKTDKDIAGIVMMSPIEYWKVPISWNYPFNPLIHGGAIMAPPSEKMLPFLQTKTDYAEIW